MPEVASFAQKYGLAGPAQASGFRHVRWLLDSRNASRRSCRSLCTLPLPDLCFVEPETNGNRSSTCRCWRLPWHSAV